MKSPIVKHRIALFAAATIAVALTGCSKKTTTASALDISEPTPVYAAPQPVAAQPVAQQVVYDTAPAPQYQPNAYANAQPTNNYSGGSYQVKKGDTLFSIAKSRYGNGNQWQRIAQANPGLSPQTLKAGQTITIP